METRPMTGDEALKLGKSLKQSGNLGWIVLVLALPFLVIALVKGLRGDMLAMGILLGVGVIILLPAAGGFINRSRSNADLKNRVVLISNGAVKNKTVIRSSRYGGRVIGYSLSVGRFSLTVPQQTWETLNEGDVVTIHTALRSKELFEIYGPDGAKLPVE